MPSPTPTLTDEQIARIKAAAVEHLGCYEEDGELVQGLREDVSMDARVLAFATALAADEAAPAAAPESVHMRHVWSTLMFFAHPDSYTHGERTGGVLAGCPRNLPPSPDEMASYARMALASLREHFGVKPDDWMLDGGPASPSVTAADPMRAHVEQLATAGGWDRASGEGAFEFLQRKSYRQGWEDGKQEAVGNIHRDSPPVPEGWLNEDGKRIISAAQKHSMLNHHGAAGKTAAKEYTIPLVRAASPSVVGVGSEAAVSALRALVAALDQPFRYPGGIEAALKPARAALAAPASPSPAGPSVALPHELVQRVIQHLNSQALYTPSDANRDALRRITEELAAASPAVVQGDGATVTEEDVKQACYAASLLITSESMKDMRQALEGFVKARAVALPAGRAGAEGERIAVGAVNFPAVAGEEYDEPEVQPYLAVLERLQQRLVPFTNSKGVTLELFVEVASAPPTGGAEGGDGMGVSRG